MDEQITDKMNAVGIYLAEAIPGVHIERRDPQANRIAQYKFRVLKDGKVYDLEIARPALEDRNISARHVREMLLRDNVANQLFTCGRDHYYWDPELTTND